MKSTKFPSKQSKKSKLPLEELPSEEISKNSRKKLKIGWLLLFIPLAGGVAVWQLLIPSIMPESQPVTQTLPPKPVETINLTSGKNNKQIKLLGQVEAEKQTTLSPQIEGTVEKVLVKEGDLVTTGMTVAIVDDADPQLALAEAEAKLVEEKNKLARLQVGTRPEIIDQRKAQLQAAQAREREAQENLKRLIALQPDLVAQRRAELEGAKVREREAQDNLSRTSRLSQEGAISQRALVEAQSAANAARSQQLGAQAALTAQETQSHQDIAQARTHLDNAKSDRLEMAAALSEAQAGPTREEIAAQQGIVNAAKATVEQAELDMQRTKIEAAFPGIVQSRNVDPGDYIEVNDPMLTLVSDRTVDIFLEVPESLSGQVVPGMTVNLSARALPDWQQKTTITAVVPTADTVSRRQRVRVTLNKPPAQLLPGMAIRGDLVIPITDAKTFIVPRDALTRRGNQWLLFTVKDQKAQQMAIEMIADLGKEVVISNPKLEEGQSIVVIGGDGLTDQAAVKVVNTSADS